MAARRAAHWAVRTVAQKVDRMAEGSVLQRAVNLVARWAEWMAAVKVAK